MRKFAAHVVPVAVSTTLVVMAGALMPPLAAWALLLVGPTLALGLALGAWERGARQVLRGARQLTPTEERVLAPALAVLQRQGALSWPVEIVGHNGSSPGVYAMGVGRRTVIVSAGLLDAARGQHLPTVEIAAVIGHAVGLTRAKQVRSDLVLAYWTLPWQLACLLVAAIGQLLWPLRSIFRAGWMVVRPIVAVGAAVQTTQQGYPAIGAAVIVLLLVTYAHPYAQRSWARHLEDVGDHQAAACGLATPLTAFLRRFPPTPRLDERTHRLDLATAQAQSWPSLAA